MVGDRDTPRHLVAVDHRRLVGEVRAHLVRVRVGARVRVRVGARVGVRVRDRDRVRVRVRVSRLVGKVRAHPGKLDAGGDAWFTLGLGCGVGVGVGVEVGP